MFARVDKLWYNLKGFYIQNTGMEAHGIGFRKKEHHTVRKRFDFIA